MKKLLALCAITLVLPLSANALDRVVSIGGDVTEIVYLLGKGSELVGADSTSYFPEQANKLPKVGYLRMLSAEGVLSLKPTLVIANQEAGPPPVLEQLKQAGVKVQIIPKELAAEGVATKIREIAAVLDAREQGEKQAQVYLQKLADFKAAQAGRSGKPVKVVFIMQHGKGAPLVAGQDTPVDSLIHLAGGENALSGFSGLRPVNPESITSASPDVILASGSSFAGEAGKKTLLDIPGIAATEAAKKDRVLVMDTLLLLGFGPRTPDAAKTLADYFNARK